MCARNISRVPLLLLLSLSAGGCYVSSSQPGPDSIDITADFPAPDRLEEDRDGIDAVEGPCAARMCGVDPASGIDCGECPEGHDCNADGLCLWRCREPTCEALFVPEGWFVRGSTVDPFFDASRQEVWLDAFWIDRFEVTNERYRACVDAGVCSEPVYIDNYEDPDFLHHPVVDVTYLQAVTYCNRIGGVLPTEAQWEKAARGGCDLHAPSSCGLEDELMYPWGNDRPTCLNANVNLGTEYEPQCCVADCSPDDVGSHPDGASIYGVEDLVGNVSEITRTWYSEDSYFNCGEPCVNPTGPNAGEYKVGKGEASMFEDTGRRHSWRVDHRKLFDPLYSSFSDGFRCAYFQQPVH